MVESWTEVNIEPNSPFDASLYTGVLDPLAHEAFTGEYVTWHFFWEPALRLRFHWRDAEAREGLEERLASFLDLAQEEGRFVSWATGNHGDPAGRYEGEAGSYGLEVWDLIERDWMNSAELAVRLRKLDASGMLTGGLAATLEDHWSRHVHLYTNALAGPAWDMEVLLCLGQARGYLGHLVAAKPHTEYGQALAHADAAIGCLQAVAT
jgi:hypothetical protein